MLHSTGNIKKEMVFPDHINDFCLFQHLAHRPNSPCDVDINLSVSEPLDDEFKNMYTGRVNAVYRPGIENDQVKILLAFILNKIFKRILEILNIRKIKRGIKTINQNVLPCGGRMVAVHISEIPGVAQPSEFSSRGPGCAVNNGNHGDDHTDSDSLFNSYDESGKKGDQKHDQIPLVGPPEINHPP